jgi:predicted Zn-dependent protease
MIVGLGSPPESPKLQLEMIRGGHILLKTRKFVLGLTVAGLLAGAVAAVPFNTLAAAAPAAAAQEAKTFTHEGAGVTFDVPAGWKAEADGEQLTVAPAGGGVSLVFWVPEEDDFDAAAKALGEELAKQIQELKFDGEPKADKHNGMDHASVSGSGKVGGKEIHFSADILEAKKTLIVLTFGTADNLEKHAAEYTQLVKSIKKIG